MSIVVGAGRTRIEVRSLWFLLVYASEILDDLATPDREILLSGEHDNDLLDAVGLILVRDVEKRLRSMLAPNYERKTEALTRVRGRINHLGTARRRLMDSGRVLCSYSQHTVDLPRYRYMLVTLRLLAETTASNELLEGCARVSQLVERRGVRPIDPSRTDFAREQYGRHDAIDKTLVRLCALVRQMRLPEHSEGDIDVPVLQDDEAAQHKLRNLFETAVRNFYRFHLESKGYSVRARSRQWSDGVETSDHKFLPTLDIDALIRSNERQIVLECKFGPIFEQPRSFGAAALARQPKLKAGYVRQIFTYCEVFGSDALPTEGVVLAARVSDSPGRDLDLQLGQWPVRTREIDLTATPSDIRSALLSAIDQ